MKSSKCSQCGFVGWSDQYCKACGAPFTGPYQQPDQAEGQQKSLAVAALILGIISFLSFGMLGVGAIIGIIVSVKAMKRVSREPWKYGGRSMAIAGLVLNITALASVVPGLILVAIAVPNLRASARAANEGSAAGQLEDQAARELLDKARTKVIPFLDDAQARAVQQLVEAVESASNGQLDGAKHDLDAELRKYSYLF